MRGLLGPAYEETTEEQRQIIDQACDMLDRRWPGPDFTDSRTEALNAMLQVVLGDAAVVEFAEEWHRARAAEHAAREQMTGAIIATSLLEPGVSEVALAERLNITRVTLRKALMR